MKVLVHKTKGMWRVYAGTSVTEHDTVVLHDVVFVVIPELQTQVRASQKRVPHAYALGELVGTTTEAYTSLEFDWKPFQYDVFTNDAFVLTDSNQPLVCAEYVVLTANETLVVPYATD